MCVCIYICIYVRVYISVNVCIYQILLTGRMWHKINLKRSLTGFNSEFSFSLTGCLTKAKEPSLYYYLTIAGRWIIGFIPFPRVLVLWEMWSAASWIWTRVAVYISHSDNHYTSELPICVFTCVYVWRMRACVRAFTCMCVRARARVCTCVCAYVY